MANIRVQVSEVNVINGKKQYKTIETVNDIESLTSAIAKETELKAKHQRVAVNGTLLSTAVQVLLDTNESVDELKEFAHVTLGAEVYGPFGKDNHYLVGQAKRVVNLSSGRIA
jgi:hypothetical protein